MGVLYTNATHSGTAEIALHKTFPHNTTINTNTNTPKTLTAWTALHQQAMLQLLSPILMIVLTLLVVPLLPTLDHEPSSLSPGLCLDTKVLLSHVGAYLKNSNVQCNFDVSTPKGHEPDNKH